MFRKLNHPVALEREHADLAEAKRPFAMEVELQTLETPNKRNNVVDKLAKGNFNDGVALATPTSEIHVQGTIKTALTPTTTSMVSFFSLLMFPLHTWVVMALAQFICCFHPRFLFPSGT